MNASTNEMIEESKAIRRNLRQQTEGFEQLMIQSQMQMRELNELRPENEIMKEWIHLVSGFPKAQIKEAARIERMFPGSMERASNYVRKQKRELTFGDFVEAAKNIALDFASTSIRQTQILLLREVGLSPHIPIWGKVDRYVLDDVDLLPKSIQDEFGRFVYEGTPEAERRFIKSISATYVRKRAKEARYEEVEG